MRSYLPTPVALAIMGVVTAALALVVVSCITLGGVR